jgi:SagB-type dehydrogenase family enzyme
LYPLETAVLVGKVLDIDAGVYRYSVPRCALTQVSLGDRRERLIEALGGQEWIATACAVVFTAAAFARTTAKYGERGHRYVFMEAGLAAANLMLQAVALGLASTIVGAFDDDAVAQVAHLAGGNSPVANSDRST